VELALRVAVEAGAQGPVPVGVEARGDPGVVGEFAFAAEQREAFLEITAAWSPEERTQFAQLLTRYGADATAWPRKQTTNRD
jgi:hypothetical protein